MSKPSQTPCVVSCYHLLQANIAHSVSGVFRLSSETPHTGGPMICHSGEAAESLAPPVRRFHFLVIGHKTN